MSSAQGAVGQRPLASICVYCGSSDGAAPDLLMVAAELGDTLAREGLRLVYGGGGVGLMGACARAARARGGDVLGVIPAFLVASEAPPADGATVIVGSMHARKMRMFEEADAFVALPGGIGTLEEIVELLSWRRLGLHAKPLVFLDPNDFWRPLMSLFEQFVAARLTPPAFLGCWARVTRVEDILPALSAAPTDALLPTPRVTRLI